MNNEAGLELAGATGPSETSSWRVLRRKLLAFTQGYFCCSDPTSLLRGGLSLHKGGGLTKAPDWKMLGWKQNESDGMRKLTGFQGWLYPPRVSQVTPGTGAKWTRLDFTYNH